MPFANVNDHTLYFEDNGAANLPTVLFSHGFVLDHTMWEPMVTALSHRYRCIVWDSRGHGMSDCRGPFDFWDLARDALALLDTLGIEHAVHVGMSQGGFAGLRAALLDPDRVAGVINIDSAVQVFSADEMAQYGQMAAAWTTVGPVGDIAEAMRGIQFGPHFDWTPWLGKWQSKPPSEWKHSWQSQIDRDDISSRLDELTMPIGFIHGDADPAIPIAYSHQTSAAIPNSLGVIAIAGGAHGAVLTHPTEVTAALCDQLAKITSGDRPPVVRDGVRTTRNEGQHAQR
ncbi:alpha/beta fold hydrolase [Mycolicibacterium sp. CH28]|uniref:alpha/beta fold hydrolase n=1 Tax=Mycolicibacterium sp. CH28 TaxID=2512237 RepID=UPI0013867DD8|nr:alpha/beta hydrolase [Mycolicibacterium sp. CH28]